MLRTIRRIGILPAFYAGFTAVTRDESRHVNYGVGAIQQAVVKGLAKNVEGVIEAQLEPACWTIFAPDRKFPLNDPSAVPEQLRVDPREVQDFSLFSLTKRLRVAGLSQEFCDTVTARGKQVYGNCVKEYEDRHGEEHPIRWWERNAS
jgi:ribonucleoside-diphosphate reductase beta chain